MIDTSFLITVRTENKLTNQEILEILYSFQARLQGYSTTCPDSLSESEMQIKYFNMRKEKINQINGKR